MSQFFYLNPTLIKFFVSFLLFFVLWVLSWQLIAQTFQFHQLLELLKILEKSVTFRKCTICYNIYHLIPLPNNNELCSKDISKFISTTPFLATKTYKTKWTINISEWFDDLIHEIIKRQFIETADTDTSSSFLPYFGNISGYVQLQIQKMHNLMI